MKSLLNAKNIYKLWDRAGIYLFLAILFVIFALTNEYFRRPLNLSNILVQSVPIGIAAIGMTFAIASGVFDLSVASTMGFSACVMISLTPHIGFIPAVCITIIIGAIMGLINGIIITQIRITPFIVTLGTMWAYRSLSYIYTQNKPYSLNSSIADRISENILGIPILFIIMIILFIIAYFLLYHTLFGRYTCALGSNRSAAVLCGINNTAMTIFIFIIVGIFAALGGMALGVRLYSAKADTALGYELTVIATVVLGGTSLKGGKATLAGTFGAAMLFAVLYNAMDMYQLQSFWQKIALGGVLLLALAIDG